MCRSVALPLGALMIRLHHVSDRRVSSSFHAAHRHGRDHDAGVCQQGGTERDHADQVGGSPCMGLGLQDGLHQGADPHSGTGTSVPARSLPPHPSGWQPSTAGHGRAAGARATPQATSSTCTESSWTATRIPSSTWGTLLAPHATQGQGEAELGRLLCGVG